ncbi:MAG: hypothetical protein ACE5F1_08620 [Planctomycetota bacterium]
MSPSGKLLMTALLALTQLLFLPGTMLGCCTLDHDGSCCSGALFGSATASEAGTCCGGTERECPALPGHDDHDDEPCPCVSGPLPAPPAPVSGSELEKPERVAAWAPALPARSQDRAAPARLPWRPRTRDPVGPDIYLACRVLLI